MEDIDKDMYMTADEAVEYLNVSHSTLYAYVSRKNIRSIKVEGSRSRIYWAEDIKRVGKKKEQHSPKEAQLLSQLDTSITLLTDSGVFYRGKNVIDIAKNLTVEEAAQHIWQSGDVFNRSPPTIPNNLMEYKKISEKFTLLQKALLVLPYIEQASPRAFNLSFDGYNQTSVDVIRWIVALVTDSEPSSEPIHENVTRQLNADPAFSDLIRQTIILSIDHELDPSTVAVRATANTGVTPYMAVASGLIAFHGRRLAYGDAAQISDLIDLICGSAQPKDVIYQKSRQGERVVGFGSSVHDKDDPRAVHLLGLIGRYFGSDQGYKRIIQADEAAKELGLKGVGFTFLIIFLGKKIKHSNPFAIAGIGRSIGWLAHANEQFNDSGVRRLRAQYKGGLPKL